MAKPVLKRSRAARRGLLEEGDGKDLHKLPRAEPQAVKKSIIRTTIKNENLLARKMEALKIKKNKKPTKSLRSQTVDKQGVLLAKIAQSIARAKMVQNARKAGWDQINRAAKVQTEKAVAAGDNQAPKKLGDDMEEDLDTEYGFADEPAPTTATNRYALLAMDDDEE